jgi:hypothetical protein
LFSQDAEVNRLCKKMNVCGAPRQRASVTYTLADNVGRYAVCLLYSQLTRSFYLLYCASVTYTLADNIGRYAVCLLYLLYWYKNRVCEKMSVYGAPPSCRKRVSICTFVLVKLVN